MASSTRVLSAAVLVAVIASTVWLLSPWATVVLASIAAALAGGELAALFRRLGDVPPAPFVGIAAALACAAFALHGLAGRPPARWRAALGPDRGGSRGARLRLTEDQPRWPDPRSSRSR